MTVNQLDSEIRAALNEYKRLVDHKWTLHPAEYGDATLASAEREELHNLLTIRKDIPKYNEYINELKGTDKECQEFCLKRIPIDLADDRITDESKLDTDPWWWLIDRLDQLTPEQKSKI